MFCMQAGTQAGTHYVRSICYWPTVTLYSPSSQFQPFQRLNSSPAPSRPSASRRQPPAHPPTQRPPRDAVCVGNKIDNLLNIQRLQCVLAG